MTRKVEPSPFLPPSFTALTKKSSTPRILKNLQAEIWNAIKVAWEVIRNPIDPDWRKNQKYRHVLDEIAHGLMDILENRHEASNRLAYHAKKVQFPLRLWVHEIEAQKGRLLRHPSCPKGSKEECLYYVKKALQCLIDERVPFRTERDRYKACLNACEKALATDHYKSLIKENRSEMRLMERTHPEVAFLHAFALSQFTCVNTQGFTESLAQAMAKEGGYQVAHEQKSLLECFKTSTSQIPAFTRAVDRASRFYKIAPTTNLGVELKASHRFAHFYPIKNSGNPVNLKYSFLIGGRIVSCVRSPTITVGMDAISPLFKAYLRALKTRGLKHTYFNLQDRREPHQQTGGRKGAYAFGFIREDMRAKTIEQLNEDPEFKGVISVFTFDKDSDFYQQRIDLGAAIKLLGVLVEQGVVTNSKQIASFRRRLNLVETESEAVEELLALSQQPTKLLESKNSFIAEFKRRLWDPEGAFYLPKQHQKELEAIIDALGHSCFGELLSPLARQDLIELSYEFMSDYLLQVTKARYFIQACKENADRGGGSNCQKLSTKLLTEILIHPDRENLKRDVEHIISKINEDALWARKRAVNERMWRTVQTLKRIGDFAANRRAEFLKLVKMANGGVDLEVILKPKATQRVKKFRKDFFRLAA